METYLAYTKSGDLRADVLKVSHHGAKTSSEALFLNRVKPKLAVISVGADNRFGHPSAEVVKRLEEVGAEVLMTKNSGTITMESNGENIKY